MKNRIILLVVTLLVAKVAMSQLSGDLGVGYNYFTNNYKDFTRSDGMTIQLGLHKDLTAIFSFSYGMDISFAREESKTLYYPWTDDGTHDNPSLLIREATTLNFQVPLVLNTEIINDKLFLLAGIAFVFDNYYSFGSVAYYDPERTWPESDLYHTWPEQGMGFGTQLGIQYQFLERLGVYGVWKTTKNKTFGFQYMEVGLKVRVFKDR